MGSGKKVTIGYRYFLGMHLVVCHGPVDEVLEIRVGDRVAWSGNVTSSNRIFIDNPELFGGEKKEGGVQGDVDLAFGESGQTQNNYLQGQIGTNIPAFRGVLSLILNKVYIAAMNRYIKPWSITVKRSAAPGWYDAAATIGGTAPGSTNPAHIIYEALTDPDWGLGLPPGSFIDDVSFRAAADTLYSENFGISLIFTRQGPVGDFITEVLAHINGVMYSDVSTGKYKLKLIREPTQTELNTSLVLDRDNIISFDNFERPSFAEMVNEVVIVYRPQGDVKDASLTFQDLSSTLSENGIVSQTLQYPGIDNDNIATKVGQRELRQASTPLAKVRLTVDRSAWNLTPGDIVRLSWDDYGISNLVIRVFAVNYGSIGSGQIQLDGTEDIYSLPDNSYLNAQPSEWVDPIQNAQPSPLTRLIELSSYDLRTSFSSGELASFTDMSTFVRSLVIDPPTASPNYQLWLSPDNNIANYQFNVDGSYTPSLTIDSTIFVPTTTNSQTLSYSSSTGILPTNATGQYGYINDEMVLIEAFDQIAKTITIRRGLFDTVPVEHPINSILLFAEEINAEATTEYMADPVSETGDTIFARALVQTDINLLDINTAPFTTMNLVGRQAKPYSPARVQFSSQYFPNDLNALLGVSLTWEHRDRLTQLNPTQASWFDAGVGSPEAGVTYTVTIRDENDVTIRIQTGLTTPAFNYTSATELLDSTVTTSPPSRTLVTTGTALATSNIAYNSIIQAPLTVRNMGVDFATVNTLLQGWFINGTTGVLTTGTGNLTAWRNTNTINPFSIKTGTQFINSSDAGTQPNWAIAGQNAASIAATDLQILNIDDYRATSDVLLMPVTREESMNFYVDGSASRKVLHYFDIGIHAFPRTNLNVGTIDSIRNGVESYVTGLDNLLDAPNETVTGIPSIDSPYGSFDTVSARPPWKCFAMGSLVYIIYRGFGTNSYTTSSKFLDIKNILDNDITVYSSNAVKTKRMTLSGNTLTTVDTTNGIVFAGRSNVADDRAIQWEVGQTSFNIINTTTGATVSTVVYTQTIKAMTVDWVNNHIFIIRDDNDNIVKLDYTGVELANVTSPIPTTSLFDADLKVSSGNLYVFDRITAQSWTNDKNLSGSFTQSVIGSEMELTYDFDAQIRADSNLILANNTIYDENGGTSSATPTAEPRQNSPLTVEIAAVRDGVQNFQSFTHSVLRSGYGYSYGNFYGE